jgi:hypothetical protein
VARAPTITPARSRWGGWPTTIGSSPEREAAFDLFENTYYKAGEVTRDEMASVLKAPTIAIRLDPRLAEVWGRERLELPVDGLSEALDAAGRRFDCPR